MTRPSNKIIILLIVAVLIVGGTFFFKNFGGKINWNPFASKTPDTQNQDQQVLAENEINKDSDNDGLKDWEEKLWKTDLNNPDTDGDGTPDGEEVKEGRDPTIPNTAPTGTTPNDTITKAVAIKKIIENSGDENLNATDKLSRAFLAEYLGTKPSSGVMSDADKSALIGTLAANSITQSTYKHHDSTELKILEDGSQAAIKNYGNILGKIIITNTRAKLENETSILQSALTSGDKTILSGLDPIIARYRTIIEQGMKISIPPTATVLHLNFINALTDLAESINNMKVVFEDPLTTLNSLSAYSRAEIELEQSIRDLNDYFQKNGVVFSKNEYGYTFRPVQ
ncbi:MAG: hypothetical protein PHV42_02050 [Candidatus Pacebacteria bacterium]|nr:hypothetical protein [Candidatus Paceibacterota bacterium]